MFNWFGKRGNYDNVYKFPNVGALPEPKDYPDMPRAVPPIPQPRNKEHYRVGSTVDGQTTLTVMADGSSMTLTMNQEACEHLIKMLRASYVEENEND